MNKRLHRVVFNASRGTRMVVQETARSAGKAGSGATSAAVSVAALAAALLSAPLHAQIVADPNAPGRQRPTVLAAPNGVPLVNIQTPSAAGVSRNTYSQFDVQRNGAVLNNSRTNAQTQLGGWVQGNPWLAGGSARVILNEVNSGNPSQLRGYVEVAGPRSEVIIANPAGIQVDGAGFINASRATLTTGVPQFGAQGVLDNFVVRSGTIGIDGAGLDVRSTDYAAILARAVQVNAGIWASELKVVTGAHQVGADASQAPSTTPVAGTGTAPAFAVDVAQLGGMYANKITLVGTEAGVGMRSAGLLGAGAGGLIVTAAGRLENIGTLEAPRLDVAVTGDLVNRGTIRQSGSAALTVAAPLLANTNGGTIGAEPVPADTAGGAAGAEGGNPATGATPAGAPASTPTTSSSPASPAPAASPLAPAAPLAPGSLGATSAVRNDGGHIYAGGPVHLQTPRVDNTGGQLEVASLAVDGPTFTNAGGVLKVQQGFSANVEHFDNAGGRLQASTLDIRSSDALNNRGGALTADGDITLSVAGALDNVDGRISGGRHVSVDAGSVASSGTSLLGAGVRADGSLAPAGDLRVSSAGVVQAAGTLVAAGDMALQGARLDLSGSRASAAAIAFTATQGDVVTRSATVSTPGMLAIQADAAHTQTLVNEAGVLSAGRMALSAAHIANTQGGQIVQTGTDAQRIAVQGRLDNSGGVIASNAQDLSLAAATLHNEGGAIDHAGAGTLSVTADDYQGAQGRMASQGTLVVRAGRYEQAGGSTSATRISIEAADLGNRGGRIVQTGADATRIAVSGTLVNDGGTLASHGGDVSISAGTLSNAKGRIEHAGVGELALKVGDYQGNGGEIASSGALVVQAAGAFQQDGGKTAAERVRIEADSLSNRGGTMAQSGADSTHIAVAGTLDNTTGLIASNGTDVDFVAGTLVNEDGSLQHAGGGTLSIDATRFAGARGQVATDGALVVHAGDWSQDGGTTRAQHLTIDADALRNVGGQILQVGDQATRIEVAGTLANDSGTIASNGADMALRAGSISNAQGQLQHAGAGTLSIDTASLDGPQGRIVGNGALVVHAGSFGNDAGVASANQVSIDAVDLSNRGGTISQGGTGTTRIAASGRLVNDGGTLSTRGEDFALSAGALSNAAGAIQHAGTGELNLHTTDYQGTGGSIASNGAVVVQATRAFQQDGGTLQAERIAIDAGALSSRGGQIVQVGHQASHIAVAGVFDNSQGVVISNAQDIGLAAATFVNEAGTVQHAGTGTLAIDVGTVRGAGGNLASNGTLELQATHLLNDGASIQAGVIAIDAGALSNRGGQIVQNGAGTARIEVAGLLDNRSGLIGTRTDSGAAVDLAVQSIENADGRVVADGDLKVRSTGDLRNDGGVLRAGSSLDMKVEGTLGNAQGRIEAAGEGASLALQANVIDNTDGRIANAGSGTTALTATSVTNASNSTDGTTGVIAGNGSVAVTATTLQNLANGHLSSGGAMLLNVADRLTNRGVVESNGTLEFDQPDATLDNASGRISAAGDLRVAVRDVVNDGGSITTAGGSGGDLSLATTQLSNVGGTLSSDRDLRLSLPGSYSNAELLHAGRDLIVTLGGRLDNSGTLEANGTLRADVAGLDNAAGGRIQATHVDLHAAGALDNRGEITGDTVVAKADSVSNTEAGAITGGSVTLAARSIVNAGPQALIAATDNVALWATERVSNTHGATVYSGGDVQIAGSAERDADGRLSSNTGMVLNSASTIEAERDIEMAATSLRNERLGVSVLQRERKSLDEQHTLSMPTWWRNADGNNFAYNPNASNYSPYEVYYVNPSDIISRTPYVTPDGYQIERIEYRTHANDTAFFSGRAGRSGAYGHRERLSATDGTRVLYAIRNQKDVPNPDQVAGVTSGVWEGEEHVTHWDAAAPAFDPAYGNCAADCVRFVTQPGYTDPTTTLIRDTQEARGPSTRLSELRREAHTVAYDDVQAPGAGEPGRIVAGRDISVGFTDTLVNSYADVLAGRDLYIRGPEGAVVDEATKLYRHYQFDGERVYADGVRQAYSRPDLSVEIGEVGGVLSGARGVTIIAKDVRNVDTSAGSAANIVEQVQLASGGTPNAGGPVDGASANGANAAAGTRADQATGKGAVAASGATLTTNASDGVDPATGQGGVRPARGFTPATAGRTTADAAGPAGGVSSVAAAPGAGVHVLTGGLYTLRPEPGGSYLYETRPAFANYRDWLSSDYLFNALGLDPNHLQKRLGDGFYEQKLIREQVASLTGQRYLDGYASDDAQYAALMTAGATFAQHYGLRPGIALTPEQMAMLTSDIVWMQTQTVTLPDGSTQDVLVPKVYVAQAGPNAVKPNGALITGDHIRIEAGNIVNRGGAIGGANTQRAVLIASADIVNQGGLIQADTVGLKAGGDILNQTLTKTQGYGQNDASVQATGSITSVSNVARIVAKDQLVIDAGRDVVDTAGRIGSGGTAFISGGRDVKFDSLATGSSYQANVGASRMTREATQANVGTVTVGQDLQMVAGRDMKLEGTQATAGGNALLSAGRHMTIDAATSGQASDQRSDPAGTQYRQTRSETTVQGASVKVGGNLIANAGTQETGNLTLTGSTLSSEGLTSLHASGNVVIDGARQTSSRDDYTHQTDRGLVSKKTTVEHEIRNSDTTVRSSVEGAVTSITADHDIDIEGARIRGDDGVLIVAGDKLTIREARDTRDGSYQYSTSKSGLGFTNGLVVPEKKAASDTTTYQSDTAVATTIESQNGGVLLKGNTSAFVQGAQIRANKDLTLTGGTVVVTGATNYESGTSERTRKNSNIGTETGWRDLGQGINAKRKANDERQESSVVRTTLEGANVNVSATGANGEGGVLYLAGTTITTPGKLTLEADKLVLGTQTTQVDVSSTSEGRDVVWQKAQGQGSSDQTTHYVQVNAGQVATNVNSVQAGLGARDSIEALSQQPGMGWINQINGDPKLAGKVDWARVEEAHTKWDYKQQGLTPEGAAIVTLVAAYFAFPAAQAAGASAGAAVGGGMAGTVMSGAVTAGVTTLASQVAVAVINNKGDLGAALHDLGSSENVKGLVTAIVTGGMLQGMNLNPTGTPTVGGGAQEFMNQLGQNLQAGAAKAVIGTAINGGSLEESLKNNLKSAFIDTLAAQGADQIGDWTEDGVLDDVTHKMAHAIAGCAVGAAKAGSGAGCGAGALGAAMGELSAELYGRKIDTVQFASMMGGIAVAMAGGDEAQINLGSQTGANAAANNYVSHSPFPGAREIATRENARLTAACEPNCTPDDFRRIDQQVAAVERAADLAEVAKRGVITPDQAASLAQTLLELAPVYGTGESVLQLITGRSSLTGEEADRLWAAVGLVPLAGGAIRKVGEPVADALTSALRALEGPVFKTTKEATQAAQALGFRRINETVNGQAIYTDGKLYLSRDVDGHNGGAWKVANSAKDLGSKDTRVGTFNSDLTKKLGD